MKCSYHNTTDAVSTCADCGVGLCSPCTAEYSDPICSKCNRIRVEGEKSEVTKNIVLTLIAGSIGFLIAYSNMQSSNLPASARISSFLFNTYLFAGIPFGWAALNRITPAFFLTLPLVGWVFYFTFKFILSGMVGLVALPMAVVKIVRGKQRVAQLDTLINEVEERQLSTMQTAEPASTQDQASPQ